MKWESLPSLGLSLGSVLGGMADAGGPYCEDGLIWGRGSYLFSTGLTFSTDSTLQTQTLTTVVILHWLKEFCTPANTAEVCRSTCCMGTTVELVWADRGSGWCQDWVGPWPCCRSYADQSRTTAFCSTPHPHLGHSGWNALHHQGVWCGASVARGPWTGSREIQVKQLQSFRQQDGPEACWTR